MIFFSLVPGVLGRRDDGPTVLHVWTNILVTTCKLVLRLGCVASSRGVDIHIARSSSRVRTIIQSGEAPFNKRGASTPLWEVEACSPPSRRPKPIPAIPPYAVKTPQLHGAPTTEETSFVKP